MKERPILFSTPMVQAILDGRKSQTRRTKGLEVINKNPDDWQFEWADFILDKPWRFTQKSSVNEQSLKERNFNQEAIKCPYGKVSDILWVRETWCFDPHGNVTYLFKQQENVLVQNDKYYKWKPSIFMPKEACRIKLEITNIRVERVRDISHKDCIAEGIIGVSRSGGFGYGLTKEWNYKMPMHEKTPQIAYQILWGKINGKDSWKVNPWVWVIEFKRI